MIIIIIIINNDICVYTYNQITRDFLDITTVRFVELQVPTSRIGFVRAIIVSYVIVLVRGLWSK